MAASLQLFCGPAAWAAEGVQVHFDQATYQVQPSGSFTVSVVATPPPVEGLFSYGVRVNFPGNSLAASSSGVVVPAPLDFNGAAGAGAWRIAEAGAVGVKGTISPDLAAQPYLGSLIASFTVMLSEAARAGDQFELTLDLLNTVGPTETVFVDGAGRGLDGQITFGSARVTVVPEPSSVALLALASVLVAGGRYVLLAEGMVS